MWVQTHDRHHNYQMRHQSFSNSASRSWQKVASKVDLRVSLQTEGNRHHASTLHSEHGWRSRSSTLPRCRIRERSLSHLIVAASIPRSNRKDGRVVKALDLSSNGRMSAWVRTPLLTRRRVITSTSRLHSVVAIISRECAIRARPCNVEARCRLPCV